MITVILTGGRLGNLLFQYAAGRRLAVKNKTTLRLSLFNNMTRHDFFARRIAREIEGFNIEVTFSRPVLKVISHGIRNCLGIDSSAGNDRVYYEDHRGFDPHVLLLGDGAHLNGLFQSEKYFKDIEQVIRNDLKLTRAFFDREAFVCEDKIVHSNAVGVHVRRGDYLSSGLHNVCNMNYYVKAIEYMADRLNSPQFFIFSDDIEWCRKNIPAAGCFFVDIRRAKQRPVVDFQLMSLCNHNIISNSTYSWWAAWLNGNHEKIVVAPNRWSNDQVMNEHVLRDTIPDDWVKIDV